MAFSEQVRQLCPSVSNEQATAMRELIVEARQQVEADPELMAMGLQKLKDEVTDQGYEWEDLVWTMHQLTQALLSADSANQLETAWNDSMACNTRIDNFAVMLNRDYPTLSSMLLDLADEALEEHQALSGLAGGTHIGKGIATASRTTGKALASPWNKNSKLNKTQKRIGEAIEVGIAGAALFSVGRAAGKSIYAAGEKRQLWGVVNTKFGGEAGPSLKDLITEELPGDWQGPHFRVAPDDRGRVLDELIASRDRLIGTSGPMSREQEIHLYENAKAILLPGDGEVSSDFGNIVNKIECSLHPDPAHREMATNLQQFLEENKLPESMRQPLAELDRELISNGIKDIRQLDFMQIQDQFKNDPLNPNKGDGLGNEFGTAVNAIVEPAYMDLDRATGWVIHQENPSCLEYINYLRRINNKLTLLDFASQTGRSIAQIVAAYRNCSNDDYTKLIMDKDEELKTAYENALMGRDDAGNPWDDGNDLFFKVASSMDLRFQFGHNPQFEKAMIADRPEVNQITKRKTERTVDTIPHETNHSPITEELKQVLGSRESELESAAEDVDMPRLERELERNVQSDNLYKSQRDSRDPSVRTNQDLRRELSSDVRPGIPSSELDDLKSDVVDEAKALGSDVEKAAIGDIADIVEAEEDIIESE